MITRKEAKEQGLKKYFTGKPCKHGHISERRVDSRGCIACRDRYPVDNVDRIALYQRQYQLNNKDRYSEIQKKYREKEGFSVYKATYPSGVYIGSGQTVQRRSRHLAGNSDIAKTLSEKALSFEVLVISTREYCAEVEVLLIDSIGLNNLLNKKRR